MRFLFILFVVMPLIEILVLIQVGQAIGVWYTLALVVTTAFIGINLLRQQGLSTLLRARSRLDSGEIPAKEMVEGLILAVGGALLVTPGLVTDVLGFCCLIPLIRLRLLARIQDHLIRQVDVEIQRGPRQGPGPSAGGRGASSGGDIIDGDYRRED